MLGALLAALPVVAVIAACDLGLLYGALWLGAVNRGRLGDYHGKRRATI
jgi:hypothetical protein